MKTKCKLSGFIIRSTVVAVLLSSAIVTFAWAVNLAHRASNVSIAQNAAVVKAAAAGPVSRSTPKQIRTLSFAERVAYQRAIEEVYWRHRIWPKENGAKPPLEAVM